MKLTEKLNLKNIVCAMLALAGLLVIAVGSSYADYTNQDAQRGVARNRDTETVRFSSNQLQLCNKDTETSRYVGKNILFTEKAKEQSQITFNIEIYNYLKGNISLVNERDISYKLTLTFEGGQGNYSVDGNKVKENTYVVDKVILTGRSANTHTYNITISGADIDNVKITATAVPDKASVTNNQILAAVISPCTESKINVFSSQGTFIDASNDSNPIDYDAFNYEVSISSGKADVTLTWNPEYVEIDEYFLKKIGKSDISTTKGSVTFEMDQDAGSGDYLIPFYIVSKENIKNMDWDGMKEIIKVNATKK